MFDTISGNYDFLNHFLSFGIDIHWRKKAVKMLVKEQPKLILDVATGTGDFALEALSLKPSKIIGVDISEGMLEVGRKKMLERGVSEIVEMRTGDSENLPFQENMFDAIIDVSVTSSAPASNRPRACSPWYGTSALKARAARASGSTGTPTASVTY